MAAHPQIFLIGFNKCGTSTFHHFFSANGVSSVHHHFGDSPRDRSRNLAFRLLQNINVGRPPLHNLDLWTAYSDLSYATPQICIEGCRFFRELHSHYPDAYFVLNTRPVEKWIQSRMNHANGTLARRWMSAYQCDRPTLAALWRQQFEKHHEEVTAHWASGDPRFMVYNLETSHPQQLVTFLASDFSLNAAKWKLVNVTLPTS
jgi:hypothetical protein